MTTRYAYNLDHTLAQVVTQLGTIILTYAAAGGVEAGEPWRDSRQSHRNSERRAAFI